MKKISSLLFSLTLLLFFTTEAKSQNAFAEGDIIVNAGIGLGTVVSFAGSGIGIGGGVEYGVTDDIGVGAEVGFSSGSGVSQFAIAVKGSYHFNRLLDISGDELDFYAGLGLNYRSWSFDNDFIGGTFANTAYLGFHAGARYYFTDNLAGWAELGNSFGWLKLGVSLKI